ncbi:MAG: DUF4070 domain-containing protein [Gaiellales bacterium]|nr:MAG: DUF4070 domain-containing protein [Gaiellales bacterium]
MKVLMVYPEYPDTFWSFRKVLPYTGKKAVFPPLGLLTVANMLPADWEKKVVDLNASRLRDAHLEWADMVMVSAMIVQEESAEAVIRRAKAAGKTVVAGGPLFTNQKEETQGVDYFVLGEAEVTLPRFLEDFARGEAGHRYEQDGAWPSLEQTPVPDWSLVSLKNYTTMAIQNSRGCPHKCEFCDIRIMFGQKPRLKSGEKLVAELQHLYDAGWRGTVFVVDDNFIGNISKIKAALPKLVDWQSEHGYPFKLMAEADVRLAEHPDLMALMSSANFYKVFIGIETPSLESLKECAKFQNVRIDPLNAVRTIMSYGLAVMIGVIVGFDADAEREDIFADHIRYIRELGTPAAMVGLLSVLPKTDLEKRLISEGRLLERSRGENAGQLTFVPRMPADKLIAGYHQVLSNIYSPKVYYQRVEEFLKHYRPTVRKSVGRHNLRDIRAFVISIFRIGLFSRNACRYWRLLIKVLATKPKAFSETVELIIWGCHFQAVTKRIIRSA